MRSARAVAVAGLLATLGLGAAAQAADLRVVVAGLRSDAGSLLVAACDEAGFLTPSCPHTARAPAAAGEATIRGVPPGVYAVQAIHDENDNMRLDLGPGRRPLEGMSFSRDARIRFGPPRFDDAAVELREPGAILSLTMRYFQ